MKKLLIISLIASLAGFSQASELWWTIGTAMSQTVTADGEDFTWGTANIYANDTGMSSGGELIKSYTFDQIGDFDFMVTSSDKITSGNSFYIELVNSVNADKKIYSYVSVDPNQGAISYASLVAANAIKNNEMATPTAYSFSNFSASQVVPEPTTGLLMLFGLAGLALKRRRA